MDVAEPPYQYGQKHVSYEAELLKALQASIADLPVASVHGQGAPNKFGVHGWELSPRSNSSTETSQLRLPRCAWERLAARRNDP